jgi:molybdopterin-biosynthesis enzyme MoeA-like protein
VTVGAWAAESEVADLLRATESANDGVAIGSYPFFKQGRVGANFVVRSEEESLARQVAAELEGALAAAGYDAVDGGI